MFGIDIEKLGGRVIEYNREFKHDKKGGDSCKGDGFEVLCFVFGLKRKTSFPTR